MISSIDKILVGLHLRICTEDGAPDNKPPSVVFIVTAIHFDQNNTVTPTFPLYFHTLWKLQKSLHLDSFMHGAWVSPSQLTVCLTIIIRAKSLIASRQISYCHVV